MRAWRGWRACLAATAVFVAATIPAPASAIAAEPSPAAHPAPAPDAESAPSDEVIILVTVPSDTPPDDPVHIAGDFQDWQPASEAHLLRRLPDGRWRIALRGIAGEPIEFKFARGMWSRVEKGPLGEEIPNRRLTPDAGHVYEFEVAHWADHAPEPPPRAHTITGNVTVHSFPEFLDGRSVWIWRPPGYDVQTERRYPVLYMWDGQNVFDEATSFAGEWQVDESAERLVRSRRVEPLIVVAIGNGGAARLREYTPWAALGHGGGGGIAHLDALVDVLKPRIDAEYRTLPEPWSTGIAGSSLGGLMALYAGWARPDVFGKVAAFSPTLSWVGSRIVRFIEGEPRAALRVYADMGTRESGRFVDHDRNGTEDSIDEIRRLERVLRTGGLVEGAGLRVVEDEGGRHHETAWARRFPPALEFLFPATRAK